MLSPPVFAIPLRLLWQVRINRWQKLHIGICLCLGIVDIFIASMRFLGLRIWNTYGIIIVSPDDTWEAFWFYLEPYVAIILVSVTAFNSAAMLIAKKSREKKISREKLWIRTPMWSERENHVGSPSIPSATLTGTHTFVRGGPCPSVRRSDMEGPRLANEDSVYGGFGIMSE